MFNYILIIDTTTWSVYQANIFHKFQHLTMDDNKATLSESESYSYNIQELNYTVCNLGVFGGFDAHGLKTTVSWTRLSRSALSGSPSIILEEPVDWSVGDEVVIAPSRFDAWETETRFITAISEDQMTLTLDSTLRFDHLGNNDI